MFKSINESLDKMYTPSNRLQESKINVVVDLGTRKEYVPFDSEWAAKLKAQDYSKCKDVKKVDVIDNATGEVIYSSQNDSMRESKSVHRKSVKAHKKGVVSEAFNKSKSVKDLANWMRETVDWLVENDAGCGTYRLDDRLAVCVGWEDFGDGYETVAGIKVWTSDSMRTDYEWINAPYYEDGDVIDTTVPVTQGEDFEKIADWLISEYIPLASLEIEKDGRIVGDKEWVDESLKKSHRKHRVK